MTDHVTAQGLQIPTIEELVSDTVADEQAGVDPNIDTSAESIMGNVNGIIDNQLREAWEALAIAYNGFNPDAAEDFLLDTVSAITGTKRNAATPSRFFKDRPILMSLNATTTVPAGTAFTQDGNPSVRFTLDAPVTSTIAGNYPGNATCTSTGPIACNAGTLIVIATPVTGLNAVANLSDAFLGTNVDTNAQLRVRREQELRATGKGTVPAIRAAILTIKVDNVEPVVSCTVTENTTLSYDLVTGLPPKSLNVLVFDGLADDVPNDVIAQTIWDTKPAGIPSIGASSGTAIDDDGVSHTVSFDRPIQSRVKITVSLNINTALYVGDSVAKQTILDTFTARVLPNQTLRFSWFVQALGALTGVNYVESIQLGLFGSSFLAAFTDLTLGSGEIAYTTTPDLTVNHV